MKRAGIVLGGWLLTMALLHGSTMSAEAQTPPSRSELESYRALHRAAHDGDVAAIRKLVEEGAAMKRSWRF